MNFVNWFANLMISTFGLESEMSMGLSVYFGIMFLILVICGVAGVILFTLHKTGLVKLDD